MITISSISLTHNKQLDKYNEMVRSKTYRWNISSTESNKKGHLFGFYFYGKFVRIHEIIDSNDILVLTQQLIEIPWNEWLSLNGPKVTKTKKYDLIHYPLLASILSKIKKEKRVDFKEPFIEVPSAKIMKRFINKLNKEVEYDGTLWQIIYCLNNNIENIYNIWKHRDKLLLNVGCYQNNCDVYSKHILRDYRIIAQTYGKWLYFINEKFEINNGRIVKYDGIKKEYLFLDSKHIKWDYYERSKMIHS